jgi:ubiquinone/menaquinone biosynthesis C-methylase UbiE
VTADLADAKLAAIECWTADPCGQVEGEPGTPDYARRLVAAREQYAPWMAGTLDYAGTRGLDVLDVGCGQGMDLIGYASAGAKVTGIDLTPRHAELAQMHLQAFGLDGTVVVGDAEHMPFADDSFDRVSSNGVLHHTPDMNAALREIRRVLRPRGEARIVLYNRRSLHYAISQVWWHGLMRGGLRREGSMTALLSTTVERTSISARPLVRVYSPAEVRAALQGAGFGEVHVVIRHFQWADIGWRPLGSRAPALRRRIGNAAGWYVVGMGRKT